MRTSITAIVAALVSVITLFTAPALAQNPPPAPTCRQVVFSDDDNVEYGCMIAAALDFSMPGTLAGIAAKVAKMNPKQLAKYNARLETLARNYIWLVLDYYVASRDVVFNPKAEGYLENSAIAELLRREATLLDVVAVGRLPTRPYDRPTGPTQGPPGPKGDPGPPGTCPTCPAPTSAPAATNP
jgi:hypothetical protein